MRWWTRRWQPANMAGGFHSRAVTDEALSQNMSSSADAPADKDAAWDGGWSIPRMPARYGSDSGFLWSLKQKTNKQTTSTVGLDLFRYIVNFVFGAQACSIPGHRSERKCAADFKLWRSADAFKTFTAAKLLGVTRVARASPNVDSFICYRGSPATISIVKSDTQSPPLLKVVSCCALWPQQCQSCTFKAWSGCQLWGAVHTSLRFEGSHGNSFGVLHLEMEARGSISTDLVTRRIWPEFCGNGFHEPGLRLMDKTTQKHHLVRRKDAVGVLYAGNSLTVSLLMHDQKIYAV